MAMPPVSLRDAPVLAPPGAALEIEGGLHDAVPPRGVAVRAASRVRLFVPSRGWGGRRRREILLAAAAIAILAHVLVVLAVLAFQHRSARRQAPAPPDDPPTIEMIEDQNKYAGGSKPTPPATPSPPAPPVPPGPTQTPNGAPAPSEVPPTSAMPDESTPPDSETPDRTPGTPTAPPPQIAQQPDVDLDLSDGLGYGHQDDPRVIPAAPDRRSNKMPAYPRAAGRRGEEGSVQMLVRIGADGSVLGIDVAVSSGHPDLDATAVKAVSGWHFRPARRGGVAVPTQMMQVFNYHIDRTPAP